MGITGMRARMAVGVAMHPLAAGLSAVMLFAAALSIPLSVAPELGLSPSELSSWIVAVWGIPGLLSLYLTVRFREPLVLTGNIFALIFIVSLAGDVPYAELVGAAMLAGVAMLLLGVSGLSGRLVEWIPSSVVMGVLAGAVLPFVIGLFDALGEEPTVVGAMLLMYVGSQLLFGERIPPVVPSLVWGLIVGGITGDVHPAAVEQVLPRLTIITPALSVEAVATVAPVFIVLMTLQANIPSTIVLRREGFEPPTRQIDVVSGIGTLGGSLLGPTAISMPLPVMPLLAGEAAGKRSQRHRSVYVAASGLLLIAIVSGASASLLEVVPQYLLLTVAGLALVTALGAALRDVSEGPLRLGPLFALAVSLSDISLLGFGPFFWALLIGVGASFLLERDALKRLREQRPEG